MNPWHDFCEAIATRLRSEIPQCSEVEPEATRIPVTVYREDDLYAVAEAGCSKAGGLCIIVSHVGGKNPDPAANTLRMGGMFSLSVWKLPEIVTELKADDLCWLAASAAHDFSGPAGPNHVNRRLAVYDVGITPDKKFLIWEALGKVKRLATT